MKDNQTADSTIKGGTSSAGSTPAPSVKTDNLYQKLPVIIEAIQWFKHGDHKKVEHLDPRHPIDIHAIDPDKFGWCPTLEGGHVVSPGDWIICGVHGEYYPCKPDIFKKTYQKSYSLPEKTQTVTKKDLEVIEALCKVSLTPPPSEGEKSWETIYFDAYNAGWTKSFNEHNDSNRAKVEAKRSGLQAVASAAVERHLARLIRYEQSIEERNKEILDLRQQLAQANERAEKAEKDAERLANAMKVMNVDVDLLLSSHNESTELIDESSDAATECGDK